VSNTILHTIHVDVNFPKGGGLHNVFASALISPGSHEMAGFGAILNGLKGERCLEKSQ
jgi:hypothetical protein